MYSSLLSLLIRICEAFLSSLSISVVFRRGGCLGHHHSLFTDGGLLVLTSPVLQHPLNLVTWYCSFFPLGTRSFDVPSTCILVVHVSLYSFHIIPSLLVFMSSNDAAKLRPGTTFLLHQSCKSDVEGMSLVHVAVE
jgi:hypothetical protein